eukprot:TRINITY_DN38854_c0_g2_i2.p1 TRINITY_DN38854_c0_g2~~TRINITY_DN38854_c0_g2_i2.p1  ORF type:complete len:158 (-),score=16.74 TRINITY_DN38854_c0_g2_i2:278-751(-)
MCIRDRPEMASVASTFVTTVASRLLHASLIEGKQTDTSQSPQYQNSSCSNPSTLKALNVGWVQNDDHDDMEGCIIQQQLRVDMARRRHQIDTKNEKTTSTSSAQPSSSTQPGCPSSATTQTKKTAKEKRKFVSLWVSEEEQKHKNANISRWIQSCTS